MLPSSHTWKKVLVTQLCLTLCDPMGCSLPGSSVHEILQARMLEGVAIPFSKASSWPRDQIRVSYIAGRCFILRGVLLKNCFLTYSRYKEHGIYQNSLSSHCLLLCHSHRKASEKNHSYDCGSLDKANILFISYSRLLEKWRCQEPGFTCL